MLHPSRSYKRSLERFDMTDGLVTTVDGFPTSSNKLQTRYTLSSNYTEHIRLSYFASEHNMHRWTHTYIASRKNTQHNYFYCPDSDDTIDHVLFHCPLYDNIRTRLLPAQPNIHSTLYGSTTELQRTATCNMSAMNRRDNIFRSLGDQER